MLIANALENRGNDTSLIKKNHLKSHHPKIITFNICINLMYVLLVLPMQIYALRCFNKMRSYNTYFVCKYYVYIHILNDLYFSLIYTS